MLIAFLGTHIPLLSLLASFLLSNSYSWDVALQIFAIALGATLVGTALTLLALQQLLVPVKLTSQALRQYLHRGTLPTLPTHFVDAAGTLMADTANTLARLDELIHYISHYDAVTGLPLRSLLVDKLQQSLSGPVQPPEPTIALVLISIDDFEQLTQMLDQSACKALRRILTQRLTDCTLSSDVVAALPPDKWVCAQLPVHSFEQTLKRVERIITSLQQPVSLAGMTIRPTIHVGISIDSFTSDGVEPLLQQAQMALSQIQPQGVPYQFYSPQMNAQLQRRLLLESELYGAIERQELKVYYQPLVNLRDRTLQAVEALIRWQHPTLGNISPAEFIPIAESSGLIGSIGAWVLKTACQQHQRWQTMGLPPVRMSVNLSARQFADPQLVSQVEQIMQQTGIDPTYLELEVTESFLMHNVQHSIQVLEHLRGLGVWLALDDFGTGYSSLSYLKQFPVQMLKIDRSFVQDMMSNADSAAVIDAIIALAKSLQLRLTAEGIETEAQYCALREHGCQEGQGYYFSRPVPAAEILPLLQPHSRTASTPAPLITGR